MKNKFIRNHVYTGLALFISVAVFAQNLDQSVINLWLKKEKDSKFNSPKNHNPLLLGYYADPTIIEDNGTFYIYATCDMP